MNFVFPDCETVDGFLMKLESGMMSMEANEEDYIKFDNEIKWKERVFDQLLREKASEKNIWYETLKERVEKKKKLRTFKMSIESALCF